MIILCKMSKLFIIGFILFVSSQLTRTFPNERSNLHGWEIDGLSTDGRHSNGRRVRSSNSTALRTSVLEEKIVFPDEKITRRSSEFALNEAGKCYNSTYCEDPSNYPSELVRNALKQKGHELRYLAVVDGPVDINERFNAGDNGELCISEIITVFPKSAENHKKQWQWIVNEEDFKQGVRTERCMSELLDCSIVGSLLPTGYKSSCKQKYMYRQLAAVKLDGSMEADQFLFPASCCCHVRLTGDPLTRIGIESRINQTPATQSPRSLSSIRT